MQKKLFKIFLMLLSIQAITAQNIAGKIVDAKTNEKFKSIIRYCGTIYSGDILFIRQCFKKHYENKC